MSDVFLGNGNLDGKAVFATRAFEKGELVVSYNLKLISSVDFNNLPSKEQQFVHSHNGKLFLYSSPERYVNHSSNPNTTQDFKRGGDVASRFINVGEEITTNSKKDDF